jgi:hypothetical protein
VVLTGTEGREQEEQMQAAAKEAWIAALTSGEYVQGHETLRTLDGEFCCLGVKANLLNPDGWELKDNADFGREVWHWHPAGHPEQNCTSDLTYRDDEDQQRVAEGAELSLEQQDRLWRANDGRLESGAQAERGPMDFAGIAEIIAEEIPSE